MNCINPVRIRGKQGSPKGDLFNYKNPTGILVPCGKCLMCRIKKRQEWTLRLRHELQYYDKSVFLTLTYDDDNIPDNMSLRKTDLQKFFKRLRKRLENEKRKIRYFACGEYGDNTNRPHYHAIIFGIGFDIVSKKLLKECWNAGHLFFGSAEKDSIRYVAQYIDKKYSGDLAKKEYFEKGREPVFRISSLGLGKKYLEDFKDQIVKKKSITLDGVKLSIPRYYIKKLGLPDNYFTNLIGDAECVEHFTGRSMIDDDAYRNMTVEEYVKLNQDRNKSAQQNHENVIGKMKTKSRKI